MVLDGSGQDSRAPLVAQHRLQQECRGCLAVGAGDAAEFELRFGMLEEIRGDDGQRAPPMRHFDHGQRRICGSGGEARGGVSDDGSRTLGDRLRNVAIAVCRASAKGDKERTVAHPAGIVLDAHHRRDRARSPNEIDSAQSGFQVHFHSSEALSQSPALNRRFSLWEERQRQQEHFDFLSG
jgi:hypothetical protein